MSWSPPWTIICGALCAVALLRAGTASAAAPVRYTVVVGHNGDDGGERQPLQYADDDAARFFDQAHRVSRRAWLLTAFDRTSARTFPELSDIARPPTVEELARVMGEVNWAMREHKKRGEPTELVFYFAGHGDVDGGGEGYLMLADGRFTRTQLQDQVVEASAADVNHLIIDACASYFMVPRGASTPRKLTPDMLDALSHHGVTDREALRRTGVLVSTSDAAEVHESVQVGGGVFSYLVRSAFAGAADLDEDGRVEYAEVAAFVAHSTATIDDPRASLHMFAAAPKARPHAALYDQRRAEAEHFLVVGGTAPRHIKVFDAHGLPYAELHRAADNTVTIALTGSDYFVVQSDAEEAVLVPRAPGAYAVSALSFTPAMTARRQAAGPFAGLLRDPFSSSFLSGYLAQSGLLAPHTQERFEVPYAPGAEAPWQVPWVAIGTTALGAAAVAAAASGAAAVVNIALFAALSAEFEQTRTLDPQLSLQLEVARVSAVGLAAVGVVFAAAGGGALVLGLAEEGP